MIITSVCELVLIEAIQIAQLLGNGLYNTRVQVELLWVVNAEQKYAHIIGLHVGLANVRGAKIVGEYWVAGDGESFEMLLFGLEFEAFILIGVVVEIHVEQLVDLCTALDDSMDLDGRAVQVARVVSLDLSHCAHQDHVGALNILLNINLKFFPVLHHYNVRDLLV